jgi:hypothetical protein
MIVIYAGCIEELESIRSSLKENYLVSEITHNEIIHQYTGLGYSIAVEVRNEDNGNGSEL